MIPSLNASIMRVELAHTARDYARGRMDVLLKIELNIIVVVAEY